MYPKNLNDPASHIELMQLAAESDIGLLFFDMVELLEETGNFTTSWLQTKVNSSFYHAS